MSLYYMKSFLFQTTGYMRNVESRKTQNNFIKGLRVHSHQKFIFLVVHLIVVNFLRQYFLAETLSIYMVTETNM